MVTWRKAIVGGVIASVCVGIIAFKAGQVDGRNMGFEEAASQYDFWADAFMYRDPDFRTDAVMMVPDGALISMPNCQQDETASMRLFRRPELDHNNESQITRMPGYWRAHLPVQASQHVPRGAALTGCRKKDEVAKHLTDLTKSWQLTSNMR